jgi:hypothetical protein
LAVQVRLDLSKSVSVRDLRIFLNCMPQYVDETKDLRYSYVQEERIVYLAVEFPSASQQIEAGPSRQAA